MWPAIGSDNQIQWFLFNYLCSDKFAVSVCESVKFLWLISLVLCARNVHHTTRSFVQGTYPLVRGMLFSVLLFICPRFVLAIMSIFWVCKIAERVGSSCCSLFLGVHENTMRYQLSFSFERFLKERCLTIHQVTEFRCQFNFSLVLRCPECFRSWFLSPLLIRLKAL